MAAIVLHEWKPPNSLSVASSDGHEHCESVTMENKGKRKGEDSMHHYKVAGGFDSFNVSAPLPRLLFKAEHGLLTVSSRKPSLARKERRRSRSGPLTRRESR